MAQSGQRGQREFILPKIHIFNKDISIQWFVSYSFIEPDTGIMIRFKHYKGINDRETLAKMSLAIIKS